MADDEIRPYVCSYPFGDARWGIEIHATSFEDAKRRLERIGSHGVVDGELKAKIPAVFGHGAVPLFVRLMNWWNRK